MICFFALFLLGIYQPIYGLTIEEAVEIALENNHQIKEYTNLSEAQKQRVESDESAFWPNLDLSYSYSKQENSFFFETEDFSSFAAELSYNLFNGFQDIRTLRATEHEYNASVFEREDVKSDVILDVKRAYIGILRAQKNLQVDQEAVTLLERQRRDAELFYTSGLTAKNELLKVEVELASARQDLLQTERNLQIARKTLERVMGVSIDSHEIFEEIGSAEEIDTDINILTNIMLERRSELKSLKAELKAGEYTRSSLKGGYLPSIDLSLVYERFGETNAFEGQEDPLFDDDKRAMIVASWNLFEGFKNKHDVLSQESEIRALKERIKDTEEELRLKLKIAIEEYSVSLNRIDVAKKAVEQAEENYRITDNQFRQRVATTTDLLDARFLLSRAQNDYNNAIYNLHLSIVAIERIIEKQ